MSGYRLPKLCKITSHIERLERVRKRLALRVSEHGPVCYSHSSHGFGDPINALTIKRKKILGRFKYLAGVLSYMTKAVFGYDGRDWVWKTLWSLVEGPDLIEDLSFRVGILYILICRARIKPEVKYWPSSIQGPLMLRNRLEQSSCIKISKCVICIFFHLHFSNKLPARVPGTTVHKRDNYRTWKKIINQTCNIIT